MRWRWVLYGLVSVTFLSALVGLGFRLEWWKAFGDPQKSGWSWVEAVSWIVSMTTGILSVIGVRAEQAPAAPAVPATVVPARTRDESLLDRNTEYDNLHGLLSQDRPPGVVLVCGPAGFGKTKFVDTVLNDLQAEGLSLTVYRHTVTSRLRFDVRTLIGYLEGTDRPAELHPGETRLTRLRLALRAAGLIRTVIVIESAEHLAAPGDGRRVDLQVDEALEAICRHTDPHCATVVLVSRDILESPAGRLWAKEPPISIGRLPRADFKRFLNDRGPLLGNLPEVRREVLYNRLSGNPRCVQLMLAAVALSKHGLGMGVLLDTIARLDTDDMPRRLAEILVENLHGLHRGVIQAMAAFRTPIDAPAIAAVIGPPATPSTVTATLQLFMARELVRMIDDRYALTFADAQWLMPKDRVERSALLRRVADQLKQRRAADPRSFDDLQGHFAYVAVLLAARRYPVAYSAMEPMTEVLKRWNCGHFLLTQREEVRGKLDIPGLEMLNDNELGDAYATLGDFDKANAAYGRALSTASKIDHPGICAAVRYNFGTYYWQAGQSDLAFNYYEEARKEAEQHQLPTVLLAALQGLAECHRRWGEYHLAFARADQVLAEAAPVDMLLRVARWRVETGSTELAYELIERARAASRDSEWHLAACHDVYADLLLAEGDYASASAAAASALEQAVQAHNAVAVLQALTTLCWINLYTGNLEAARQHIEDAEHYRTPGSALVVLALNALVHQKSDPGKAARLFDKLEAEARERVKDEKDRGAHDMLGFAICGQSLPTDAAVEHFDTSEGGASILRARRNFMVKRLDEYARPAGRLRPVLDALADTRSRTAE